MQQRTIWYKKGKEDTIEVIDQRYLPFKYKTFLINNVDEAAFAIKEMVVRGAPLIGVTAAYAMYLAAADYHEIFDKENYFNIAYNKLIQARPTAINLKWALDKCMEEVDKSDDKQSLITNLKKIADAIALEDMDMCQHIGLHGVKLIDEISQRKENEVVNILTHCNAGKLATVEWGTATSPIYHAHLKGIPIHVWVDETRPRNQGARLTAWELKDAGVPFTLIADNVGGYLMQNNLVDLVIVGSDRTTRKGDVCNKIGTYLKALAARDNDIPFYAAMPSSTIDWSIEDGLKEIPIEERSAKEVLFMKGTGKNDEMLEVNIAPKGCKATNYAFDVTPSNYVTGIITERGICEASEQGLKTLFPEKFEK